MGTVKQTLAIMLLLAILAAIVAPSSVNAGACVNLARGKNAYQIDTFYHYQRAGVWTADAEKATDGDRCPLYNHRSCTHTIAGNRNPWLAVDLGRSMTIDKVVIITTPHPKADSTVTNLMVAVSNTRPNVAHRPGGKTNRRYGHAMNVAGMPRCGQLHGGATRGRADLIKCGRPMTGRYVYLAKPGSGYLGLCEVEVYASGCTGFPTPKPEYCSGMADPDANMVIGEAPAPPPAPVVPSVPVAPQIPQGGTYTTSWGNPVPVSSSTVEIAHPRFPLTITCDVGATTAGYTMRFEKDGQVLHSGNGLTVHPVLPVATLKVNAMSAADQGNYMCIYSTGGQDVAALAFNVHF